MVLVDRKKAICLCSGLKVEEIKSLADLYIDRLVVYNGLTCSVKTLHKSADNTIISAALEHKGITLCVYDYSKIYKIV